MRADVLRIGGVAAGIQITAETDEEKMLLAAMDGLTADGNGREAGFVPDCLFLSLRFKNRAATESGVESLVSGSSADAPSTVLAPDPDEPISDLILLNGSGYPYPVVNDRLREAYRRGQDQRKL